ncbi:tetratricopeptide repeat protein [Marinobacterium sediminicola]|uniref:Tetratricopeptide repeat-containing protein n=1 Tax=Marinobacterium sediminicola TaxID=518898 RepID=A0ABY1S488_9GAMM|nr:tetratricopeptide repeat protein [Marinobacterium sediminicola]ULG68888.1 tetratricopeptide repeat protein [Marinobacterium sediminicola]SMR77910.1 Tetratricopeptide repeat-containing protein [Marinobacterium sediminicola]
MKKVYLMVGLALVVTGCAGPNPYVYKAPVEDRSRTPQSSEPGTVVPVDPVPGVKVTPIGGAPVIRAQREEEDKPVQIQAPVEQVVSQPQSPAVIALLETARQDSSSGNLRTAQNRLERALRIAPRDPEVYIQLADVQRRQGQFLQAEQVALKGVSVAAGQKNPLRRLWSLIADIRQEAGNAAGAAEARQKAAAY